MALLGGVLEPSGAPQSRCIRVASAHLPFSSSKCHVPGLTEDLEAESDLSDPVSNVNSLAGDVAAELGTEEHDIPSLVSDQQRSTSQTASESDDQIIHGARGDPTFAQHPKRKRLPTGATLNEQDTEWHQQSFEDIVNITHGEAKLKQTRTSISAAKGVVLGHWRDSAVPDDGQKHVVVGFIDVRDRLRTRVRPQNKAGNGLTGEYPLPPGPGGSWVTFERIAFSDHLVGLNHFQVKEYTRIRCAAPREDTEEARKAAESEAVREAIARVASNPALDNPIIPPLLAYGVDLPGHVISSHRADTKRRRTDGGFTAVNATPLPSPPLLLSRHQGGPSPPADQQLPHHLDPLPGTRPTRILLGHWKSSSEEDPANRHAVYGILSQNDMFRVKVVRETRDGRFVDGNFPTGAGALWIAYEEVEFEEHLKPLSRQEVKEYCRVRQYQQDFGDIGRHRTELETEAVAQAQGRAAAALKQPGRVAAPASATSSATDMDLDRLSLKTDGSGRGLRHSRRTEPRPETRAHRHSLQEGELRSTARLPSDVAAERANDLVRREIARAEAAQERADRQALHRERAAAAAAAAAATASAASSTPATLGAAAAATPPQPPVDGLGLFHERTDVQRLNKVWARQESLRLKAGAEDAKIYDGIKYERKPTGPFMGKLVSQGTIISIDGEDYVEYRVLTKPAFF